MANIDVEFRAPVPSETPQLLALARASGLFTDNELGDLLGATLAELHAGKLSAGHAVRVATLPTGEVLGWLYQAPTEAPDEQELLWIGVDPQRHRSGAGTALLLEAERLARGAGCSWLRVSTSSLPATAPARALYERRGFTRTEVVPDFYGPGDDAVVYRKQLEGGVGTS
jgi:ribosomal protein S18 acetylase RimI-like enzyme